mmetsp:Transcript_20814/g.42756  ORF Transcript_20814/g.42756 Transcript_20814/m.42756 type:complete len:83 (+) Transcript_20814:1184-1432(+)
MLKHYYPFETRSSSSPENSPRKGIKEEKRAGMFNYYIAHLDVITSRVGRRGRGGTTSSRSGATGASYGLGLHCRYNMRAALG